MICRPLKGHLESSSSPQRTHKKFENSSNTLRTEHELSKSNKTFKNARKKRWSFDWMEVDVAQMEVDVAQMEVDVSKIPIFAQSAI